MAESLEDHLRRATRNFTARLPEEQALQLGRDLLAELARAHAESPARYPEIDPQRVPMEDGHPRLSGGSDRGQTADALLDVGALLHRLLTGEAPQVSWRLDGPPTAEASTLRRRAVLAALSSPRDDRFASAASAVTAFDRALRPEPAESASPWPLFRGSPSRAGVVPGGSATPAGLTAAWQALLGSVVASPVLARDLVMVGTSDGRLVVVDRETGARVHDAKVASAIEASPAILEGQVLLGTDDGELLAVNVADGRVLYRARIGETVRSSPLPTEGRVLVGTVEAKGLGALVALEPGTGKAIWKRKLGPVFSSPALAGGLVLVGSDDERLHAVEPTKGELAWSVPMSGRVRATPAVRDTVAVVADFKGRVAAVRVKDGTVLWTQELKEPVYSSAALTPALAVVGCHDGHVYGLSLETGARVFDVPTGGPVVSSPVALGDCFLAASTDGQLYLIDAQGVVKARTAVATEGVQSSPALDAQGVVVGSGRGLHTFRLAP